MPGGLGGQDSLDRKTGQIKVVFSFLKYLTFLELGRTLKKRTIMICRTGTIRELEQRIERRWRPTRALPNAVARAEG
jgi:hypothetical protein